MGCILNEFDHGEYLCVPGFSFVSFYKTGTQKCSGIRNKILHMDHLFKALPLYGSSHYTMINYFLFSCFLCLCFLYLWPQWHLPVTGMCHCGQIDLCPRQLKGLYKIRYCVGSLELTLQENKSVHHNASVSNFFLTPSGGWHYTVPEIEDQELLLRKILII